MGGPQLRLLLDSNVIDTAAADESFLQVLVTAADTGVVHILVTHVQIDEILATPEDNPRRPALLRVLGQLPADRIPTYGIILGLSRWDNARFTDDDGAALIESLRGENLRHTEDALLIATAQFEEATFVSSDRRAINAALRHSVSGMSTRQLASLLSASLGTPGQ